MIRLLIVDDEPASIRIIQKLLLPLADHFEEIVSAENGIEAMQLITSCPPDLIITDMDMPALNGISLLEYLADNHPDIYIIVVSGYYDFKYTHAAIQAKVIDYLLKPLERQKLLDAINKVISFIDSSHNNVSIPETEALKVNQETYYYLLKSTQKLKQELQNGTHDEIKEHLLSDYLYIDTRIPAALHASVYNLYTDAIAHFYMEHEYPVPRFPSYGELAQNNSENLLSALQTVTDSCLNDIDQYRRHSTSDENLDRINRYIYDHYHENISLSGIAELFYINQTYLSTLFHKKYGENIGQLIIRLKIADAKRQLRYSNRTISEISDSLGYLDHSYFNKQFKKEVGTSPGQYRSQFSRTEETRRLSSD